MSLPLSFPHTVVEISFVKFLTKSSTANAVAFVFFPNFSASLYWTDGFSKSADAGYGAQHEMEIGMMGSVLFGLFFLVLHQVVVHGKHPHQCQYFGYALIFWGIAAIILEIMYRSFMSPLVMIYALPYLLQGLESSRVLAGLPNFHRHQDNWLQIAWIWMMIVHGVTSLVPQLYSHQVFLYTGSAAVDALEPHLRTAAVFTSAHLFLAATLAAHTVNFVTWRNFLFAFAASSSVVMYRAGDMLQPAAWALPLAALASSIYFAVTSSNVQVSLQKSD